MSDRRDHDKTKAWLAEYADNQSDAAFSSLVHHYGGMVYSSAIRRTPDPETAEDVTQDVFAMLARKAGKLKDHPSVSGWLFTTTRLIAHDAMKSQKRQRDKLARLGQSIDQHQSIEATPFSPDLDEALDRLNENERTILLWHFFERMPYAEIAACLGKSEEACRKQSSRALGKMRMLLSKRGVAISSITLATTLTTQLCQGAPAGISSSVLASAKASAGSLSAWNLILNSIQTMAYPKTTTALVVATIAAVPLGLQQREINQLRDSLAQEQRQQTSPAYQTTGIAPNISQPASPPSQITDPTTPKNEISTSATFEDLNQQVTSLSPSAMRDLFVATRENGHPQRAMLESILTFQLMGRDPAGLLDLKLDYPDLPVLGKTYRMWAQSDPDAALAHAQQVDNETWFEVGLTGILHGLGDTDPSRALRTLRDLEEAKPYHYENLFRSWLKQEPAAAIEAINEVPETYLQSAISTVADNLPEIDPVAAQVWIDQLSGTHQEIARPVFANRVAQLENRIEGEIPNSVKR